MAFFVQPRRKRVNMSTIGINFGDRERNFGHLPEQHLFHIAVNESAIYEYRLYAVEVMLAKGYKSADKPELAALRAVVLKDKGSSEAIEAAKRNAAEARLQRMDEAVAEGHALNDHSQAEYGALRASVTTATLSQEPIDDRTDFPPVQKMDEPSVAQDSVAQDSATRAPEVEPRIEAASQEAATPSTSEQNQLHQ
jgi:hypothetical protein